MEKGRFISSIQKRVLYLKIIYIGICLLCNYTEICNGRGEKRELGVSDLIMLDAFPSQYEVYSDLMVV